MDRVNESTLASLTLVFMIAVATPVLISLPRRIPQMVMPRMLHHLMRMPMPIPMTVTMPMTMIVPLRLQRQKFHVTLQK